MHFEVVRTRRNEFVRTCRNEFVRTVRTCEKVRILSRRVAHLKKKRGPTAVDGAYESWEMVGWPMGLRLIKKATLSDDERLNHRAYDS